MWRRRRPPVSPSISVGQMLKSSCCLLLPVHCLGKVVGRKFFVLFFFRTHLRKLMCPVRTRRSVCSGRISVDLTKIVQLRQTIVWDPNRHPGVLPSIHPSIQCVVTLCFHSSSWTRDDFLQDHRTLFFSFFSKRKTVCMPELCLVSLHVFALFMSRWQALFIRGSSRTSWPRCPDTTLLFSPHVFHRVLKADPEADLLLLPSDRLHYRSRGCSAFTCLQVSQKVKKKKKPPSDAVVLSCLC